MTGLARVKGGDRLWVGMLAGTVRRDDLKLRIYHKKTAKHFLMCFTIVKE